VRERATQTARTRTCVTIGRFAATGESGLSSTQLSGGAGISPLKPWPEKAVARVRVIDLRSIRFEGGNDRYEDGTRARAAIFATFVPSSKF
jgi:hypothetical protein